MTVDSLFDSVATVQERFAEAGYIADRPLALTAKLAADLGKPMLLEGEAGVGKTEVAKVLAATLETPLLRLQCYEGLDAHTTLYEWNHARQLLHIRIAESRVGEPETLEKTVFTEEFLLERPLLRAIRHAGPRPAVLLIDEIDRADEEFEAFLLEILSDFQITVPELGTFRALQAPFVVLTSNRTRELGDALKRRCLYLWIDYPSPEKERAIVLRLLPELPASLADAIVITIANLRELDFYKRPGIAETLDWGRALLGLGIEELRPEVVEETAGVILKHREDIQLLREVGIEEVLRR